MIPILCTTAVAASVLFINRFLGVPFKVSSSILGFIAFPLGLFQVRPTCMVPHRSPLLF